MRGRKPLDLTGQRFGRLIAIKQLRINGILKWLCRCDCGNETFVRAGGLRAKVTQSCGCYYREASKRNRKHGLSRDNTHQIWYGMIRRCYRPSHISYPYYGGRGIRVCKRWRESFVNFLADMGPRPSKRHSIDRINNNGNYEPENCKWVTSQEQCANKSNNILLTFNGETKSIIEWSQITGIKTNTLRWRITRNGWPIDRALTTPVSFNHPKG